MAHLRPAHNKNDLCNKSIPHLKKINAHNTYKDKDKYVKSTKYEGYETYFFLYNKNKIKIICTKFLLTGRPPGKSPAIFGAFPGIF